MATNPNLSEFMGVLLSKPLDNCLRLQSLLQGHSRGKLVRNIVQQYVEDNDWTEENLIERYALHLYNQWYLRYRETQPFNTYIDDSKKDLKLRHKLPENLIKAIIKECEEQQKKLSPTK